MTIKIINTKRHALVVVIDGQPGELVKAELSGTIPRYKVPALLRAIADGFEDKQRGRKLRAKRPLLAFVDDDELGDQA